MAAAPSPHPHPAILIGDLVEEFVLRLPPDDPASLASAALVSRQWYGVVTGPAFGHKFREFHHRTPPLLGYIANIDNSICFVSMSSFRPHHADLRDMQAVHSSHGRVLLRRNTAGQDLDLLLTVWDPIPNQLQDLPLLPFTVDCSFFRNDWDAAVICAVGDGCNHIRCHFKVVVVVRSSVYRDFSCIYSSEVDSWSHPIFTYGVGRYFITGSCVHVGSALYFKSRWNHEIFKYDLLTNQMCTIYVMEAQDVGIMSIPTVLIATEDGRLGVAKTNNLTFQIWLRENGRWEGTRPIEFRTLLPDDALPDPVFPLEWPWDKPRVAGFTKTRGGIIFLRTRVGYFAVDLNSRSSKYVGKSLGRGYDIIPYMSFCTPAPRAVIKDEERGAGVALPIDEVREVAVAIARDERPGAAVAVSKDEGLESSVYPVHKKLKL